LILKLIKEKDLKETEVQVKYAEMNGQVKVIINKIRSCNSFVIGELDKIKYKININCIYYIESVDKRTYIYCKEKVYYSQMKLYEILEKLERFEFVQISKSCIVNLNVMVSIERLLNSKMEVKLNNGEKVVASRKYINNCNCIAFFTRMHRRRNRMAGIYAASF